MKHFLLKLLAVLISLSAVAQTAVDGRKAMSEKRFDDAMRIYQPLAERGDAESQQRVGTLFFNGLGVERNLFEAARWMKLAASNGDMNAMLFLGNMYARGEGVTVDHEQSLDWRKKAANKNHPTAAFEVAEMYFYGRGAEKDEGEAKKYYQQFLNTNFANPAVFQARIDTARSRMLQIDAVLSKAPQTQAEYVKQVAQTQSPIQKSQLPNCTAYNMLGRYTPCVGRMKLREGSMYEGEFDGGAFNGHGALTTPDGRRYVGEFKGMLYHGQGIEYQADGSILRAGIWEKDRFVGVGSPSLAGAAAPKESVPPSGVPTVAISTSVGNQQTFQQVKALASTGDTNAQVQLGNMYGSGQGVKQSDAEALKWYRMAANKGDANGRFMLGAMYDAGRGVKQSYAEALKWYRPAADQGNPLAQHRLGVMHSEGVGVGQSSTEALKWLQRAAEHGNADSQVAIGEMYSLGKGVPQSYSEAATWYRMAASQGNPTAQYALGGLYRTGRGVVQDDNEALKWYQMAAAKGDAKSKAAMDSMQVDMAAKQRVLDQQQQAVREEEAKRQQDADSRRRAEESLRQAQQMQQQRQQKERERANLEKENCTKQANDKNCAWGCIDPNTRYLRLVPECMERCEAGKRAAVAACNGVYIPETPPPQPIIIQQSGGNPNPFPNMNKCIKDGGSLMCM